MNGIDAYRREILMQPAYVQNALNAAADLLPADAQESVVFAGSGDSLAAAMIASYFSDGRARCMDPSDAVRHPFLAASRRLYLISISGNTVANIRAARLHPGSVAITAHAQSRLAAACGRVVPLEFPSSGTRTAGSISFLASVITCAKMVCRGLGTECNVSDILNRARHDAARIDVSGSLYILGGALTYPLAMYGAAKFYEVLGLGARYARTEQFFHMELFSARRGDTVLVYEPHGDLADAITGALDGTGMNVIMPGGVEDDAATAMRSAGQRQDGLDVMTPVNHAGGNGIGGHGAQDTGCMDSNMAMLNVLYYTFLSQMLTLQMAESRGLTECHYQSERSILDASNASIY